jgi:diguanylate cyclase (GGDEF)-like protein
MPRKIYRDDFKVLSRVALGLIVLFVLATGLTIWGLRSDAIRDADNDTGNIAVVLSGQIARSIQSVDIILSDVRDQANAAGQQTPDETQRRIHGHDFYELLLSHLNRLSQANVIALIDHTGRVANSTTQWPPTGTDVSDRDYFQHFSNESDDGIFISSLLRNRVSGERMVFFSKRINGPDREFLGVVLIGLRLSYFETIYKSISPLRDQSFALLHSDGTVLVRYPDDKDDRNDQRMPVGSPWYELVASGGGNYRSPGYFDGDARFVSVRPLHDYPLVVDVAVTETAALANWYRRATLIGVGSLLALICWTLLLRLSGKQFQRLFESETKLKRLAHYDNLTGLANRVSLHNDLNEVIRANRGPTAIAIFDLDGFKDVNDTLGHSTGDHLLREVARRLSEFAADGGQFYRLGGDEFVLIKTACGDPIEIAGVVGSVLRRLAEKFEIGGHQLFVGASAGIAMAPTDGADIEELVSNADLALYDAKSAGGNACRLFLPVMRARTIARRELDGELRRASANREFELFFQPQVRTSDGTVTGAEALLRWRHPQRGILAPGAFIDALSESPVVLEVGRWILQSACEQAAAWRQAGFPLRIGVNLFSAQFHGETLIADVEAALSHSGLPPDALEIEITENIALGEQEESLQALHTLRARGVKLAFDDFGTGYASLSYLARYPLTRIKIDQSFVRKIAGAFTLADTAIVRSIILMAHHLGLEVIAEGVETATQVAFLRAEKCEELQGYLYAKPLPAADFEAYLRTNRDCDEDADQVSDEIAKLA